MKIEFPWFFFFSFIFCISMWIFRKFIYKQTSTWMNRIAWTINRLKMSPFSCKTNEIRLSVQQHSLISFLCSAAVPNNFFNNFIYVLFALYDIPMEPPTILGWFERECVLYDFILLLLLTTTIRLFDFSFCLNFQ